MSEAAELCVTELVANVITHVGEGTPTSLALSINGVFLRIEVEDPDLRVLPTLLEPAGDSESGRGMQIISAVTAHWGVLIRGDRKVTWCEMRAGIDTPHGHVVDARVDRAEALIDIYMRGWQGPGLGGPLLGGSGAEEPVIGVIAELLHWLRAHGFAPEEALERARSRFEGGVDLLSAAL